MTLEVHAGGVLSTIQDLGRPGLAGIGVGVSGAADRASLRLANRLVGNPEDAATIEVTFGGLVVSAARALTAAVTGADCSITVDGREHASNAVFRIPSGATLRLGSPKSGLRNYLALRGGIAVNPVLGSRSTDVLAELGPDVLRPGMVLPIGAAPTAFPTVDLAPIPAISDEDIVLTIVPGPREDWFERRALSELLESPYLVTPESNRIGMRLAGPRLNRCRQDELPSEGMVRGALQVPPTGQPTLFLADHPVTGGYPVIAVVVAADVDKAAQARPGRNLRFRLARRIP